ncbi:arylamine N-acetyltransferase 1 [Drepanopeziza brunnea f. sp. 'multigermtubi' MB_m1]|uniref:TPA: arylamine N-acetyltransferase 1 n=1 Tax=Marssonina brunnea f. sp. multigermtubi (strain MB_m1) TaxID=1072389 RepID=K1WRS3_MARBU|nr:arylamine N-acetyltransferase 1 [Drepanopeziza brunnea f. sp. 'multigermtubi' MB_m1]EKD20355.1 arylamine N-acetyltransferase 1 [Drepanopeziza brunnea f. sp. 'multigermtubi' MB_m1]
MAFSHRPSYALPALKKYFSHISLPAPYQNILLQNATREHRHHVGTLKPAELFEYLVLSQGIASEGGSGGSSILAAGKDVLAGVSKVSESEGRGDLEVERVRRWEDRGASGGRGGTCTLNNTFFGTVMRSFGMRVLCSGARVAATVLGGERYRFCGWNHLINLVEFEGKRWLVDVGFGGDGPACPIELADGREVSWGATGNTLRLIYAPIQEFEDPNQRCWILQHRQAGKSEWDDVYCFTETEFLPQDIAVMNFKTTGDVRTSFFNHVAFCGCNVVEEGEVIGKVNLAGGKCKRTVWRGGKWEKEVLGTCESEVERWEILERVFGIVLGDEERKGISGMVSELRRKPKDD